VRILKQAQTLQPDDSDEADRQLGDLYFDMGKMPEARDIYAKVLDKEKDPSMHLRVLRRFIEVELKLDIPEKESERTALADAIRRLDDQLKSDPKDVQALILRAFACARQNSVETEPQKKKQLVAASMDYLNKVLAIDPKNSDALYYRAQAYIETGADHLDDAIRDLTLSVKGDLVSPKGQMLLASIYRRSHRYEEASLEYMEVLDKHPGLLKVRVDYADFLMSLAQQLLTFPPESSEDFVIALRRLDPAGKLYELVKKSQEMYPNQAKWPFMYAQLLEMQDKNDIAQRIFESLLPYVGDQATMVDAYLEILCKTKNYPKAVDTANSILVGDNAAFIEKNPEWAILYIRRAAALLALGKSKEAAADVDKALDIVAMAAKNKNYNVFAILLVKSVGILSDSDDTQAPAAQRLLADRLQARLAANPEESMSRVTLMQMLLFLKQPDEALKIAQGVVLPQDDDPLKLLLLRQMAMVKYEAKQYAEAEKDFNAVLAMSPNDIQSLNNYAFMLADVMNQAPKAVEVANRALQELNTASYESEVTSSYADVYDTLGWAQLQAGKFEPAIIALQHSVQTQPSSDAYYHLAKAYQVKGDVDAAMTACKNGVRLATKRKDSVLTDLTNLQVKLSK
jgi:tetratricopeptide (TPR) repeat protein